MLEQTSGIDLCEVNRNTQRKNSNLEIMFCGFLKEKKSHLGKLKKRWFGLFEVQYYLPNNIIFLVSINNFEPNLVLVNINKLKPYKYVDQTLEGI
jgi:hypothetical protein